MCGVAGVISLREDLDQKDFETVKEMTEALKHRGPSQQGHFESSRCMIGNARLAIIDPTENSRLPMSNREQNIWICYNGEVSNFRELKEKYNLESKYDFKGQADTEVLIYLYQELGIKFLNELSGMFAFCLLDLKKNKAYVVRDFYGINPMFYYIKSEKIYFGSEIKAFLEIPEFSKDINYESMYHYFTLGYIPGNRTPYNDLQEMRGGQYLEVDLEKGTYDKTYYYDLEYDQQAVSEKEATKKVHDLMLDSTRRNLISDAPLGMTLSGGIDTSAMLALVKELGRSEDMHTFSLKMGESSFDESKYQRIMSDFAGTKHHEILVTPDNVIENLVEHIAYIDEPSVNGASIPSFILAKEATKYVSVLLSGEGGDEVFNAYPTIAAYQIRNLYRKITPKPIRSIVKGAVHAMPASYKKLSFDFKAKRFTKGAEFDTHEAHLYWRHVFTESEKKKLLNGKSNFMDTVNIYAEVFERYKNFDHEINKISITDIKHFFIDDLMVKNDRTFMANSVEGRFPLMDRFLVDYVIKLPVNLRVKGFNKLRYIQKKAMEGLMPKEVLNRASFGLEMPHSMWFLDKLGPFAEKYLNKKFVEKTEYLKWEEVERLWNLHKSGKRDCGRAIWSILMYLIWFDLFVYSGNYKTYWHTPPNK